MKTTVKVGDYVYICYNGEGKYKAFVGTIKRKVTRIKDGVVQLDKGPDWVKTWVRCKQPAKAAPFKNRTNRAKIA